MPSRSSSTAAASFLDREEVIAALRGEAATLLRSRPDVRCILLFGSLARGDHARRSDADILICIRGHRGDRPRDRIPEFLPAFLEAPVPVDVFPFTENELELKLRDGARFWARALAATILLAGQPPAFLRTRIAGATA